MLGKLAAASNVKLNLPILAARSSGGPMPPSKNVGNPPLTFAIFWSLTNQISEALRVQISDGPRFRMKDLLKDINPFLETLTKL